MSVSVQSWVNTTVTSRSPATTFSGYTPVTDDIIYLFMRVGANPAAITVPSGWTNVLGGTTQVAVTNLLACAVCHPVTSAEAAAVTTTYTPTNLFNSAQTTGIEGMVLRGVDPANVIDAVGTDSSDTGTATHVLAGLAGANLTNNALVVGSLAGGATSQYTTDPTGWTNIVKSSGGQATRGVWSRNALAVAGSDIATTNVTIGTSARYASITVAFAPFVSSSTQTFFAMF